MRVYIYSLPHSLLHCQTWLLLQTHAGALQCTLQRGPERQPAQAGQRRRCQDQKYFPVALPQSFQALLRRAPGLAAQAAP